MIQDMERALADIRAACPAGGRVIFVSGNFNIVHPGHLRLLNFAAECGDFLVVGIHADRFGIALLPEALRLEGVKSIGIIDYAFVLRIQPEAFIHAHAGLFESDGSIGASSKAFLQGWMDKYVAWVKAHGG